MDSRYPDNRKGSYWHVHGRSTESSWPADWCRPPRPVGWTADLQRHRWSCCFGYWNTFRGWVVWTTGDLDGSPVSHWDSHSWTQTEDGEIHTQWLTRHFQLMNQINFTSNVQLMGSNLHIFMIYHSSPDDACGRADRWSSTEPARPFSCCTPAPSGG